MDITVGFAQSFIMVTMILSAFSADTDSRPSCAQLEFESLETTDTTVIVRKNSNVTLTFYLVTDSCIVRAPTNFVVNVSSTSGNGTNNSSVVCSFILRNQICIVEQHDTAACRCRNQRKGILQFRKRINHLDDESYLWSWMEERQPSTKRQRKLRFDVTFGPATEVGVNYLILGVGMLAAFVTGVVVTTGISVCIVKCRHGRHRCRPLLQDKARVTGYKALGSCSTVAEASTEDGLYEDVVDYENEMPFVSVKIVNVS